MRREEEYMERAMAAALLATCERARCGSVLVKDNEVIGEGFNSPPKGLESERRCQNEKSDYDAKVTDKTCCVHAEVRAIQDALRNHPDKIEGAELYFIRLGEGGKRSFAGEPYCTICSKAALDAGVAIFYLWHKSGIKGYPISSYHRLSYAYRSEKN